MQVDAIRCAGAGCTSFGRKLRGNEKSGCENAVKNGLETLDKNMAIILPTTCCPQSAKCDTGIGLPHSDISNKKLYPFLAQFGYTKQQKQPSGLGKPTDPSPYVSNSSAYNTAVVDLSKLTKAENGKILSKSTYNSIVQNNPKKGMDKCAYLYNQKAQKEALNEAYYTFLEKSENIDELEPVEQQAILQLQNDFEDFKLNHGDEQEINALYNILSDIHGNDYFPNWNDKTDENLFSEKGSTADKKARKARLKELKNDYSQEIDSFLFSQMLAKNTIDKGKDVLKENGIETIGDIAVADSDAQVWGHKDLYLTDMRMGCKEPWGQPQKWGFFVRDPELLFNKNGSLNTGGKDLYNKYKKAFEENKGGVRIDHIVGLMDPYVYSVDGKTEGRLYSELYKGVNGKNYDKILKNIVLKAAQDAGLDSSNIIAEDLGYMPDCTKQTLNDLNIGGVTVTQWCNAEDVLNAPYTNTAMVGNHDTASAGELYPNNTQRKNKFVELFCSGAKNIQIFWTDMFGIKERYNQPGVSGDSNWALRMTEDFEDKYYKAVSKNEAINIPQVVLEANRKMNPDYDRQYGDESRELQKYAKILKE